MPLQQLFLAWGGFYQSYPSNSSRISGNYEKRSDCSNPTLSHVESCYLSHVTNSRVATIGPFFIIPRYSTGIRWIWLREAPSCQKSCCKGDLPRPHQMWSLKILTLGHFHRGLLLSLILTLTPTQNTTNPNSNPNPNPKHYFQTRVFLSPSLLQLKYIMTYMWNTISIKEEFWQISFARILLYLD